jgi:hypothetical protein
VRGRAERQAVAAAAPSCFAGDGAGVAAAWRICTIPPEEGGQRRGRLGRRLDHQAAPVGSLDGQAREESLDVGGRRRRRRPRGHRSQRVTRLVPCRHESFDLALGGVVLHVGGLTAARGRGPGRRRHDALDPREEAPRPLEGHLVQLDVPLSEAIDLLAELGVRSPVEYDDYLKGLSTAMAFVKTSKA